jgi:hypothetical protein
MGEKQGHTPGPWVGEERKTGMTHIRGSNGRPVCYLKSKTGYGRPEFIANANLLLSAPDLLFALSKIAESGVALGGHHRALAVAAIAKATGEDSPANEGEAS